MDRETAEGDRRRVIDRTADGAPIESRNECSYCKPEHRRDLVGIDPPMRLSRVFADRERDLQSVVGVETCLERRPVGVLIQPEVARFEELRTDGSQSGWDRFVNGRV
ncbi:hypothetical protein GCM10009000_037830 [Halobacterium noricense]